MDTSPTFDLAVPVRYSLTHRAVAQDRVDLVLDLFRGGVQIHSRTIASVDREQAVLVMAKCRRYLQLRGVDAAPSAPAAQPAPAVPAPARPAAAQSKSPTVTPMRPAAGVKPMAVAAKPVAAAAKPVATKPLPERPLSAKPGLVAARTAATKPATRQDRPQERREARMPAPAAAAFDWMFEAV
jgi:hypothetical protein